MKKPMVIAVLAIVVVIAAAVVEVKLAHRTVNYDSFAKCLNDNGAKMYGAFWCQHCQAQEKAFGSNWKFITYVECSTPDGTAQTPECAKAGIQSYPTWEFKNGGRQSGELSFDQLSQLSGCPLP